MKSNITHPFGSFPVPLGRIAAIQVMAISCLIVFNLLPLMAMFFALGVNLADFTLTSDFSFVAFCVFAGRMLIDMGMYLYAMGDAKRSASRFLREANPRDLIDSEMARTDQPGELAVRLTNEYLKAKTGICIGFSLVNLFVIGLLITDPTYLNVVFALLGGIAFFFNCPSPGRVRKWILKTMVRNRSVLEEDWKTNQIVESKSPH